MKKKIIIIGSSPYLLIEALYNTKKGYFVEIIEEKPHLGGNWYLHNYGSYISEGACHILSPPDNKVYDFLKENLGIKMEVQTPQCFDLSLLKPCYDKSFDSTFTDDATVFEGSGHTVHLVEGESTNIKITTPADLKIAEAILGLSS